MVLVLAAASPAPACATTPVTFADSDLESAARAALSKPSGDISDSDMASLSSLNATSRGISNLDGLQYATNLTSLDLSDNQITDPTPLRGLTGLARLDLSDNKITTVTVLSALSPGIVDVGHNWLDVSTGSAAMAVVDGWLSRGAAVTCLSQGRSTTCAVFTTSKKIGYAATTVVAGTLGESSTTDRIGGCSVRLQSSSDGITFTDTTASYETTSGGTFAFSVAPTTRTYYRVSFAGSSYYYLDSTSQAVCLTPCVRVSTPTARSIAYRSTSFASHAYLKQRHAAGTRPLRLQCYHRERQSGGTYKWILRKTVSAKASNYLTYTKVTAAVSLQYSGKWRIRACHAADSVNATTYSSYRYLSVKDRRVEAAIRRARAKLGSHKWDHYCMRFVTNCYGAEHHFRTARQAADALHASAHPGTDAPRGAYVFYHSMHGRVDLGHVGISLGNGTMISDNGDEGVVIRPIKYGLRYIGWTSPPVGPRITERD